MKKKKVKLRIIATLGVVFSFVLFYGGLAGTSLVASGCGGSGNSDNSVPSGWKGTVYYCNPSANNSSASGVLHIEATCITPLSGATGNSTMKEDIPVTFPAKPGFASSASFTTAQTYKQGTWNITKVQVMQLTGALSLTNVQLPGDLGKTVFDFTGGSCQIQ